MRKFPKVLFKAITTTTTTISSYIDSTNASDNFYDSERDDECNSTLPDLITDDSRDVLIFPQFNIF